MPTGRTDHYCGVVMRSDNRCLEVVVAGGRDYINGAYLDVVEIYDVGTDSWREGIIRLESLCQFRVFSVRRKSPHLRYGCGLRGSVPRHLPAGRRQCRLLPVSCNHNQVGQTRSHFQVSTCQLIRYEPANDTWTELPVHLYQPREFAVAMTIAADLFPEC